jgi:hypothetical protein
MEEREMTRRIWLGALLAMGIAALTVAGCGDTNPVAPTQDTVGSNTPQPPLPITPIGDEGVAPVAPPPSGPTNGHRQETDEP